MSIRDEMVRCPFDQNHRVSRARFPVHLIKCRKQHKTKNFSICPYNATHYILTPEFQFHMENCPDRKQRDLAAPVPDDTYTPPKDDIVVPPPSEIWGEDGEEVVSYLAVKDSIISKLPILRTPSGLTKSERKKFMRREVQRFRELSMNQPSTSREPNTDSSDMERDYMDDGMSHDLAAADNGEHQGGRGEYGEHERPSSASNRNSRRRSRRNH